MAYAPCTDGGGDGTAERQDAEEKVPARTIAGIDPSVAFVVPTRDPDYLYYSGDATSSLPPEIATLLPR